MNFKTNLLVFIASVSVSSLSVCQGMQNPALEAPIGSGVIQGVLEPANMGAFGAVRPVEDNSNFYAARELPPIVSPSQAEQASSLPPIVSASAAASPMEVPQLQMPKPKQFLPPRDSQLPPIVAAENIQMDTSMAPPIHRPLAPMAPMAEVREAPMRAASMLSPIAAIEPPNTPVETDPTMAPPTIIQASQVPATSVDDGNTIQKTQWTSQGHNTGSVSSAGIPLYSNAVPRVPSVMVPPRSLPPIISANSQLVSPIKPMAPATAVSSSSLPPIVTSSPIATQPSAPGMNAPPLPMSKLPSIVETYTPGQTSYATPEPAYLSAPTYVPTTTPTYAPAPTPSYAPASSPAYFSNPPVEPPVIASSCNGCGGSCASGTLTCSSCSNDSCGQCGGGGCTSCGVASRPNGRSGCSTCGNKGCFDPLHVISRFGNSGSVSDSRRYLHADFLYFDRNDGTISNSNFGSLNAFDSAAGARITLGAKSDALRGREMTYMGITPVEQGATRNDALGRITARFTSNDGFTGTETSAFRNATSQTEFKETEFHALEFNKVTWGWDVIKSFAGIRYIHVDDQYRMTSTNLTGETGLFELGTQNNLIGPHIGGEIFYDVGYRMSYSMSSKAGVYANFNNVDTRLVNDGAEFMNIGDSSATISTSVELSLLAHYQLSRTARLRAGYNLFWIGEVASVSDNFNPALSPTSGTSSSDSDDMFFHGLSVGIEIFR